MEEKNLFISLIYINYIPHLKEEEEYLQQLFPIIISYYFKEKYKNI